MYVWTHTAINKSTGKQSRKKKEKFAPITAYATNSPCHYAHIPCASINCSHSHVFFPVKKLSRPKTVYFSLLCKMFIGFLREMFKVYPVSLQ
jgi:hypothetical protein